MKLPRFGSMAGVLFLSATGALGCSDDGGSDSDPIVGSNGGSSAGGSSNAGGRGGSAGGMGNGDVSFAMDVYPILSARCGTVGCHGDGSFLPQHANTNVNTAFAAATAEGVPEKIAGRVAGTLTPIMPQNCGPAPGLGTCLSLEQVALIREWVEQGAAP